MADSTALPQAAVKYNAVVQEDGRIELTVPFARGAQLTIFVIAEADDSFHDMLHAAATSITFWDNSFDDEDWNDRWCRS